jgi:hypothetical protein
MSAFKRLNRKYTFIAITLIAMIIIYVSIFNKQTYGNDKGSIIDVIQSIDGFNSESIEILEIKDIHNNRIVSFLLNDSPAFIQFYKTRGITREICEKKEENHFPCSPKLRDENLMI